MRGFYIIFTEKGVLGEYFKERGVWFCLFGRSDGSRVRLGEEIVRRLL